MMEKLKVINLAKSYDRDVPVLRDISFCVDDRDFFVILGPSGCGKTTLLNIIAGVEDINGGEIYIDGIRVNENKPQKRDVAMVFQNYALYPTMNVFDNIAFPLRNRHFTQRQLDDYANQHNPNNHAYWDNLDNHANQCNPNNDAYWSSRNCYDDDNNDD